MVMIIGLGTMTGLVWVLASSMVRESDAEKRRVSMLTLPEVRETLREAA